MPNTNRRTARSARGGAAADSLYERLKQLRPVEQQEALEEQEAYWEEDDLQVGAAAGGTVDRACLPHAGAF